MQKRGRRRIYRREAEWGHAEKRQEEDIHKRGRIGTYRREAG